MTAKAVLHPIAHRRSRRKRQAEERALEDKARRKGLKNLRRYRTPVQVCPRGCGYHEIARRDLILKDGGKGRRGWAEVTAAFVFETNNCPKCGAPLLRKCARCHRKILAPVVDLCRACGLPQPWAAERRAGTDPANQAARRGPVTLFPTRWRQALDFGLLYASSTEHWHSQRR